MLFLPTLDYFTSFVNKMIFNFSVLFFFVGIWLWMFLAFSFSVFFLFIARRTSLRRTGFFGWQSKRENHFRSWFPFFSCFLGDKFVLFTYCLVQKTFLHISSVFLSILWSGTFFPPFFLLSPILWLGIFSFCFLPLFWLGSSSPPFFVFFWGQGLW